MVPDYRLDDRATGVRSQAEDFPLASCTMGTEVHFPGGTARLVRHTDHTSSVEVKNEYEQ